MTSQFALLLVLAFSDSHYGCCHPEAVAQQPRPEQATGLVQVYTGKVFKSLIGLYCLEKRNGDTAGCEW